MLIEITKGEREDRIAITRDDGGRATFNFPKKGPLPHDAVHFFVERELGLASGLWGLVADGMDPAHVGALAMAGGHASAKRASEPAEGIVALLQAERLVECFEAESWSGGDDNVAIRAMAEAGWRTSLVPPLDLSDESMARIRTAIAGFAREWYELRPGETARLVWERDDG